MERKNLWEVYSEAQLAELEEVNKKYCACLDAGKTERECVRTAIQMAEAEGYKDMNDLIREGAKLSAGDKVYMAYNEKALALFNPRCKPRMPLS